MPRTRILALFALATAPLIAQNAAHKAPKPPKSLRLYVFDCGVLKPADAKAFGFDKVAVLSDRASEGHAHVGRGNGA